MSILAQGRLLKMLLTFLVANALLTMAVGEARVVRFVVEQKRVFADGESFGDVGRYERLDGTAYFEVDPQNPLNAVIVNLDKAPQNPRGTVEFSAPFFILKPIDMRRSNHKIFYGINNRGNKQALGYFNFVPNGPRINNPLKLADAGDGFLMRLGYVMVDAGWQGDAVNAGDRLVPNFPVATRPDGSAVVAKVRIEYSDRTVPAAGTFTLPLEGSGSFLSYPTAIRDTTSSTLTARDTVSGLTTQIARSSGPSAAAQPENAASSPMTRIFAFSADSNHTSFISLFTRLRIPS